METVTGVRVAVATDRGTRTRNEDAIGVNGWAVSTGNRGAPMWLEVPVATSRPALVAVVDGMGGAPAGHRAARIAAYRLTDPTASARRAPPEQLVAEVFAAAHAAIREAGRGPDAGMACTAGVLVVYGNGTVVAANLGDVRGYRIVDTYAGQLTADHRMRPDQSQVSRCLGGPFPAPFQPDRFSLQARAGDRLLLCSDGVHDALADTAIEEKAGAVDGVDAAAALVRAAVATGHGDNATAAVLDLLGPPAPGNSGPVPRVPEPAAALPPAAAYAPAPRRGLLDRLRGR